jgi:tetratricopeptide (TPR) repeat protein
MAEQESPMRRRVALKIIKLGMDTKQVIARFEAERQVLAIMDHPNIAKVFEAGATETGRPYFVMELVRGMPITEYCDSQRLTTRQRVELFVQVCHAIQHAHQKGVIHRDIKPNNVLVTMHDDKAVPKVIDFGIAKATGQNLTEKTLFTEFRQFVGTPAYMSPEQAQLNELDVDTRSDIYSLGVLLYELLTGTTPFDPRELRVAAYDEIRRIIREVDPPKPSTRISGLGATLPGVAEHRRVEPAQLVHSMKGELDWIVMKAMEKDRTRRYETAIGLARDIQRYLADEAVEACPPTAGYKLRKFARRHRTALRVTAAFVLLLLAATVFSSWEAIRATRAKAEALAQKNRTDEQAAVAEGVNQFFSEEVFGLADPKRLDPAGITLVQALDVAASKVDTCFPDDPRLRAEIRERFGEIYIGIDRPQQAIDQLQKAVDLRTASLGAKDPITMRCRDVLGTALHKTGRLAEARDALEATLADQTLVLGEGNPDTVQTATRLSAVLMEIRGGDWGDSPEVLDDRTDLDVARNAYQSALRALGPRNLATLNAERQLSNSLRWGGTTAEALGYGREALIGLAETRGRDDPDAMWASYDYAACLLEAGHPDEAVNELQPLLAVRYRILGPTHKDTLQTAWRLAMTLQIAGKPQQSFAVLEEVQAHLGDVQAPPSWERGQLLLLMAGCYQALGRLDRAAEFLAVSRKMADVPPDEETQRRGYASWLNDLASDLVDFPARELVDVPQAVELATRACELTDYQKVEFVNTLIHALTVQGKPAAADAVYSKVISACRQAILRQPNSPDLYFQLGELLEAHQKLPEAEAAFTQAIRLNPNMAKAWAARGDYHLQMNEFAEMAEDYSEAIRLAPSHQRYWHERAYAYMLLGDDQKALADHTQTIELGDTDSGERIRRGTVYEKLGEFSNAEADYSRAIELDPQNGGYWNTLGKARYRAGDFQGAITDLEKSVQLPNGGTSYNFFLLAMSHWKLGNAQRARQYFQQAVVWMVQNGSDDSQLISFCDEATDLFGTESEIAAYRQGLEACRLAKDKDPRPLLNALTSFGGQLYKKQRYGDAEAAYREALQLRPSVSDVSGVPEWGIEHQLGAMLSLQNKFPEAEQMLRRATQSQKADSHVIDFDRANTQSWLGGAIAGQGRYAEAEPMLLDAYERLKLAPDEVWAIRKRRGIGRIINFYEAVGKPDKAKEWRAKLPATLPTTLP